MSTSRVRPRVYISYTWRPASNKRKALELAEFLRSKGLDTRIDEYYKNRYYGFSPPVPDPEDPRDPWIIWSEHQIKESDAVLLFCTEQYAASDKDNGEIKGEWFQWSELPFHEKIKLNVPGVWWDWHIIYKALQADNVQAGKFIPVGHGHYAASRNFIPGFLRNSTTYYNLDTPDDLQGVIRGARAEYRKKNPRNGVFISYAHDDEAEWINTLKRNFAALEAKGLRIWTDKDILPGKLWHDEIQDALSSALIAVLMVSPAFLASDYIASNELPQLLDAARSDGLTIFWIPIKPSAYEHTEIKKYQSAYPPDRPLSGLRGIKRDMAFVEITNKLAEVISMEAVTPNRPDSSDNITGWKVGDRVLANWSHDEYWYPATIRSINGEEIFIKFDDGDKEKSDRDRIMNMDFEVGDSLYCKYQSGLYYYSANIKKIEGEKILVRYNHVNPAPGEPFAGEEEWTTISAVRVLR